MKQSSQQASLAAVDCSRASSSKGVGHSSPAQAPIYMQNSQQVHVSVLMESAGAVVLPAAAAAAAEHAAGRFEEQLKVVLDAADVDLLQLVQGQSCSSSSSIRRGTSGTRGYRSYICRPPVDPVTMEATGSGACSSSRNEGSSAGCGSKGNSEIGSPGGGSRGNMCGGSSSSNSVDPAHQHAVVPKSQEGVAAKHDSSSSTFAYRVTEEVRQTTEVSRTAEVVVYPTGSSSTSNNSSSSSGSQAQPPVSPSVRNDAAATDETGTLGEAFVYAAFSKQLPGFGSENWHSSRRSCLGLPVGAQDPPYDFLYEDVEGKLSGQAGMQCFIEVKSTRFADGGAEMHISQNEWKLAQELHCGDGSAMYVVVRVAGVYAGGQPRIAAIYSDPVALLHEGKLGLKGEQLLLFPR